MRILWSQVQQFRDQFLPYGYDLASELPQEAAMFSRVWLAAYQTILNSYPMLKYIPLKTGQVISFDFIPVPFFWYHDRIIPPFYGGISGWAFPRQFVVFRDFSPLDWKERTDRYDAYACDLSTFDFDPADARLHDDTYVWKITWRSVDYYLGYICRLDKDVDDIAREMKRATVLASSEAVPFMISDINPKKLYFVIGDNVEIGNEELQREKTAIYDTRERQASEIDYKLRNAPSRVDPRLLITIDGQSIKYHDGRYYLTRTYSEARLVIRREPSQDLRRPGKVAAAYRIFNPSGVFLGIYYHFLDSF